MHLFFLFKGVVFMQKKATKKLKINVNEKTFEEGFEDFIISCRVKIYPR